MTHQSNEFGLDKQRYLGDSVVTGFGKIDGRTVYVYAQDSTVVGGSLSEAAGEKICKVMDLAMRNGAPVIGLNDGGGARIQEGVVSLKGYGEIFTRNVLASGRRAADLGDHGPGCGRRRVFAGDHGLHLHDPRDEPDVHHRPGRRAGGDGGRSDARGPGRRAACTRHARASRTSPSRATRSACRKCGGSSRSCPRTTSRTRPSWRAADPPDRICEELATAVPDDPSKPYDVHVVIESILDDSDFMEVHAGWARNISVGFGRMGGGVVGIVANNPAHLAGVLDVDCSRKGARFVRFCDAFNIPIVTLVDVPGYLPGTGQEYGGIIVHGAKLLYAYAEATVPKITVILRKDYGGAYLVMGSKHLRADINYAWPGAEIAVTGPDAAANVIFRRDVEAASRPGAAAQGSDRRLPRSASRTRISPLARLHRRRDRPAGDAGEGDPGAGDAGEQGGHEPAEEAREHPAVGGGRCRREQPEDARPEPRTPLAVRSCFSLIAVCGLLIVALSFAPWVHFENRRQGSPRATYVSFSITGTEIGRVVGDDYAQPADVADQDTNPCSCRGDAGDGYITARAGRDRDRRRRDRGLAWPRAVRGATLVVALPRWRRLVVAGWNAMTTWKAVGAPDLESTFRGAAGRCDAVALGADVRSRR